MGNDAVDDRERADQDLAGAVDSAPGSPRPLPYAERETLREALVSQAVNKVQAAPRILRRPLMFFAIFKELYHGR